MIPLTSFIYTFCFIVNCCLFTATSDTFLENPELTKSNGHTYQSNETIRIGLLISEDASKDPLSQEAVHAANIAVNRVNEVGGIRGRKVELITRATGGDWGIGSKQSVELIYDEEVSAIVGSLDGRNAHLAEMVATRAQVVYMATRATDPSLSQINIPWFFRVVPSDNQQAEKLAEEIYQNRDLEQLAVISTNTYDDETAADAFIKLVQMQYHSVPISFKYDPGQVDFRETLSTLTSSNSEGIVYFGRPEHLTYLLQEMENSNIDKPIFAPLSTLQATESGTKGYLKDTVVFICSEKWLGANGTSFINTFKSKYGYEPGVVAAYSYDGINILMEAIKRVGTSSEKIRENLSRLTYSTGVTGKIKFNENGDRINNTSDCN